ncbi:MAG: VWA domain-containing protein, partial [Pseudomonadota bacterium]
LDVSGSMRGPDRLPLLVKSFRLLLQKLQADDTISIVTYAGAAGTVLKPTKVSDRATIFAALDRLQAGGSTAGAAGIEQAYSLAAQNFVKGGLNRVMLATDGDFNVGISDPNALKQYIAKKRDTGIYLLRFGQRIDVGGLPVSVLHEALHQGIIGVAFTKAKDRKVNAGIPLL